MDVHSVLLKSLCLRKHQLFRVGSSEQPPETSQLVHAFGAEFWAEWIKWWTSTAISVVLLVPFLQAVSDAIKGEGFELDRPKEIFALIVVACASILVIFTQSFLGYIFLAIPVLLWTALRLKPSATSLVASTMAGTMITVTLLGLDQGSIIPSDIVEKIEFIHFFLFAIYVPNLFCSVALAERRNLEMMLQKSQRMDAVGQLSGGIAHDFNNILGVIRGNLELALLPQVERSESSRRLETAMDFVLRGAALSDKLLKIGKSQSAGTEILDVNKPLRAIETFIIRSLTAAVEVKFGLAENLWPVRINADEFSDVVLNIVLNARDALPDGGTLVIETSNTVLDRAYAQANPGSKTGNFVVISFSDDGVGMSNEIKEKLFEPFFTTKQDSGGSGLGLAMVYGFVKRAGGHIKVYSEVGVGTTFRLYLPRASGALSVVESKNQLPVDPPTGSETILVVDDEPGLIEVACSYLEPLGYSCLRAASAKEALAILETSDDIDLVFSDVIMPGGMDGYELALVARKRQPSLKFLLTSGFTRIREETLNGEREYIRELASLLLSKPYGRQDLAVAIRNRLDNGPAKQP